MRKVKLYIAMSLDGKIARLDGDVSWLDEFPNPDQSDHGYYAFYETIDTTLMGNKTYQQVLGFDMPFPYPDKVNYVFTRNTALKSDENVQFVSKDVAQFVKKLKGEAGKDIWLVGGAELNTLFFNEGLVDEIFVFVMPIVLGEGISLFASIPKKTMLTLVESKSYGTGAVGMVYEVRH